MLATRERIVPVIARDCLAPSRGANRSTLPSCLASTERCNSNLRLPLPPFTSMLSPDSFTSTPDGISTGFFATRDMAASLEYRADDFAADTGFTSCAVCHNATGCRNDSYTEATFDLRQSIPTTILAQTGLAETLDLFNNRLAVEVFQFDDKLGLHVTFYGEAGNIALSGQYLGDRCPHFGRGHAHTCLACQLCVANTCEHIRQSVLHTHVKAPNFLVVQRS